MVYDGLHSGSGSILRTLLGAADCRSLVWEDGVGRFTGCAVREDL